MTLQINEIEPCKLQIHYTAEPDKVIAKRKEAVKHLRKTKIPGYRLGKAPDYALKLTLKKEINDWVEREMVSEAYDDILYTTKAKPIGSPQVNKSELNDNQFWCDLTFMKKPDIELKQYKDFLIPRPPARFTPEEMIEKMLQELRVQNGEMVPYAEADSVQLSDKITMDASCTVDGSEVAEAKQNGILYRVGDGIFPGFDDQICGMIPGETREFSLTFSDDVQIPALKSKTAVFTVNVFVGMKIIPASLDDELAKKVGLSSYEDLMKTVQGIVTNKISQEYNQAVSQQIIRRILDAHTFEVPTWLSSMEAQQLAAQNKLEWKTLQDSDKMDILNIAKDNVKLALILDSIKDVEPETAFSDSECIGVIKQKLTEMGQDPDVYLTEAQKDGRLTGMIAQMRNEGIMQWLVAHSKVGVEE